MLNHIVIMGRLTRDPELRTTSSGVAVASFSVAVERDYSGRDGGERQTDFIDCVAWRSTGEFISKYFAKGNMICVSGRLQIRNWTDQNNATRRQAEIVVDNAYFCESKKSRESGYAPAPVSAPSAPAAPSAASAGFDASVSSVSPFSEVEEDQTDGDLPF